MFEQAKWIGCGTDMGDVCPEFTRTFHVSGEVRRATLFITAIGVYEAAINGKRVGDFILAPGCTVYRKRLQYQEYDVTGLLEERSVLAVTVGPGWHRGRLSGGSRDIHSMPAAVIAQLEIVYGDGGRETLFTDDAWTVRKSRILHADIYDGETYDASGPEGEAGPVRLLEELGRGRLIPQEGEKVCEHERLKPARYFVTPAGERVIDFGQNLAGYVEFSVDGGKGGRVVISHAEILDKEGNFYTENYRAAKAKLTYICGGGLQTYKPRLVFYGFRYIRLDEYPGEVNPDDFTAIALYSDVRRTGYIESGHKGVNMLFRNTLWSQRSNFVDIPTDCPQRDERMGWTGDAQVFCRTASYNYDVRKFFAKWMADVRADQYGDGMISDIVPNFWNMRHGSAAWGDVVTILPWQMYLTYGDRAALEENFEAMEKWVGYMTADSAEQYLWTNASSQEELCRKHYGDWLALDAPYGSYTGSTDVNLICSAFYAHSVSLLVKAGKALGRDVAVYEELHGNILRAFRERFPRLETQTAKVLALHFGLTDQKEEEAAQLVRMIRENGNRLQTGFVGTPYLLHALSDNGYKDVAYDLLFQEAFPSWLYEVNHGATTIWEHWDGVRDDGTIWSRDMNSYNHYAYGCVMDWVYGTAAGIRTAEEYPGFERVVVRPEPDRRMGWLDVSLDTVRGRIRSSWVCQEDGVRYEITTPVPAVVVIDGKEYTVEKGEYIFYGALPRA